MAKEYGETPIARLVEVTQEIQKLGAKALSTQLSKSGYTLADLEQTREQIVDLLVEKESLIYAAQMFLMEVAIPRGYELNFEGMPIKKFDQLNYFWPEYQAPDYDSSHG